LCRRLMPLAESLYLTSWLNSASRFAIRSSSLFRRTC
jgi:hypothetical protein